jgi:hypothetical protein
MSGSTEYGGAVRVAMDDPLMVKTTLGSPAASEAFTDRSLDDGTRVFPVGVNHEIVGVSGSEWK